MPNKKEKQQMNKERRKNWFYRHWDELVLWGAIIGGILLILKGIGTI